MMDDDGCHLGPSSTVFGVLTCRGTVKGKELVRNDASPMGRVLVVDKAND